MTKTTVVNCHHQEYDVYIGRGARRLSMRPEVAPWARGWLGNPFVAKDRETAIAYFKTAFLERIENDSAFREAVLTLQGKRLGCWCAPKACHGDVIAHWLDSQGSENAE